MKKIHTPISSSIGNHDTKMLMRSDCSSSGLASTCHAVLHEVAHHPRILDAGRVDGVGLAVARGGLERAVVVELHLRDVALARLFHEGRVVERVLARLAVADLHEHHGQDDPDHEPDHDGADSVVHERFLPSKKPLKFRGMERGGHLPTSGPDADINPRPAFPSGRARAGIARRFRRGTPRACAPPLSRRPGAATSGIHHTPPPGRS